MVDWIDVIGASIGPKRGYWIRDSWNREHSQNLVPLNAQTRRFDDLRNGEFMMATLGLEVLSDALPMIRQKAYPTPLYLVLDEHKRSVQIRKMMGIQIPIMDIQLTQTRDIDRVKSVLCVTTDVYFEDFVVSTQKKLIKPLAHHDFMVVHTSTALG